MLDNYWFYNNRNWMDNYQRTNVYSWIDSLLIIIINKVQLKKWHLSRRLQQQLRIQVKSQVCKRSPMMKSFLFMDFSSKQLLEITLQDNHGLFNWKLELSGMHGLLIRENQKMPLKKNMLKSSRLFLTSTTLPNSLSDSDLFSRTVSY